MASHPAIGSVWAFRCPGAPRFDRDFRVTGVFTKDGATYIESERLDTGAMSRNRLDVILEFSKPVSTDCTGSRHGVDAAVVGELAPSQRPR